MVVIKTVDFENVSLPGSSFWTGSDQTGKFVSGIITFQNNFNRTYGSWDGFTCSGLSDTGTAGYGNQYSVFDSSNGVNKFALYYPPYGSDAFAAFPVGMEYVIISINVCNSTYAALSMKNGDPGFAKKFGGVTGNDPDWFKLTAIGYNANGDSIGAREFYLADFRPSDNSKDYIVSKWSIFDLSGLGKINKLTFRFTSTDNSTWGMNTPAYVCIDNVKYQDVTN